MTPKDDGLLFTPPAVGAPSDDPDLIAADEVDTLVEAMLPMIRLGAQGDPVLAAAACGTAAMYLMAYVDPTDDERATFFTILKERLALYDRFWQAVNDVRERDDQDDQDATREAGTDL